jgi:beta-phosphoglucomutase
LSNIAGVIFDMDGVLVDSEAFIARAAVKMFAERGVAAKVEDFEPFVGMGENRYLGGVAEKYGCKGDIRQMKERTYDIYLNIIKGELRPLPGGVELVRGCRKAGLKTALASSADGRKVRGNLQEIGLGWDEFDAVICGEDVARKKPAPDIFLLAAKRLGAEAHLCIVIEDAVAGVQAAKSAGAKCIAVTNTVPAEALGEADMIVRNLGEVSIQRMAAMFDS